MQSLLYKMKIFSIFSQNNLHISEKSCTFAVSNKKDIITIRYYSQINN